MIINFLNRPSIAKFAATVFVSLLFSGLDLTFATGLVCIYYIFD